MKFQYKLFFVSLFFCAFTPLEAKKRQKQKNVLIEKKIPTKSSFLLRTVVATADLKKKNIWFIDSDKDFIIRDNDRKETIVSRHITLKSSSGKLFINGIRFTGELFMINPQSGSFVLQGRDYTGALLLEMKKGTVSLIALEVKDEYKHAIAQYVDKWDCQIQKTLDCQKIVIKESNKDKNEVPQFTVRVLLSEQENGHFESWIIRSEQGFVLMDPTDTASKLQVKSSELKIRIKRDGTILFNEKKLFKDQLYIMPISGSSIINEREYAGNVWILVGEDKKRMLINCVPIENYVASVLCTESWPGWPLEVNKVFAIASRTYVIAMVQNASIAQRPYHVKNTNAHQTYTGGQVTGVQKDAVDQTKGLFVSYNNEPITAMFDACCGGIITANMSDVNFNHAPYLARTYPCRYCKNCKIYSWHAEFDVYKLEKILKKEVGQLRRLKDITVAKKDRAGIVKTVNVMNGNKALKLSGKKIYALPGIKSFCYTIAKNADKVIFKGRGYGHHLGLCQWGARQMVTEGWDFKSILKFYYPGTKLMRLS